MNWVDIFILAWLVSAAIRGFSIGLIRQALSLGGFIAGLLAGGWLAPHLSALANDSASRLIVTLAITLGLAIILAGGGDRLGAHLQSWLKLKPAHTLNNLLGIFIGAAFVLFASWLIASALTRLPFANIGLVVEQSKIVQLMNRNMPPAPGVTEQLGRLISPHGFPQVFIGPEPSFDPAGPPITPEVEEAAAKARDSTVRIEGLACGGISTGSGFAAAPNYIVTNAHVVAGVREPIIFNQGQRHRSAVVWFDSKLDFAVLRTDEAMDIKPLMLADEIVPRGTSAAVIGYPGGGSLQISPSVILRSQLAVGRDIYNRGIISREIYALQAKVEPGNSGGPVVLPNGKVAGLIFGEAVTHEGSGYALTSQAISSGLAQALNNTERVSSGSCL